MPTLSVSAPTPSLPRLFRHALCAGSLLLAAQVASAQTWYANPDASGASWDDFFANFNTEDNGGTNPTATVVSNATYGKVWKINKPSGAKRAEFSRPQINNVDYDFNTNGTYYIGFRANYDVVNNVTLNDEGVAVFQWKSEEAGTQNYPFNMSWNPKTKELSLNLYGPGTTSQSSRIATVWRKTVNEGTWATIVIGFKFSTDANVGWVSIWYNGSKQTLSNIETGSNYSVTKWGDSNRQAYHRTKDTAYNYAKWGAYNEASRDYNMNVLLSDLRIATSYDAARPQ
jgi:hypothetical protein